MEPIKSPKFQIVDDGLKIVDDDLFRTSNERGDPLHLAELEKLKEELCNHVIGYVGECSIFNNKLVFSDSNLFVKKEIEKYFTFCPECGLKL